LFDVKFAIVPVKDLSKAKERLSTILSQSERTSLAHTMLEDVLIAVKGSRLLDRLFVVTPDERAIEVAESLGAEVIKEKEQPGESASVDFASGLCKEMGAESVLVIPGDAPLIVSEDIDFILEKEKPYPSAILVPSRDEMGTNAILRKPPDSFPSRFGYDSFRKHINEAKQRNIPFEIYRLPRIALDIDEPKDLEHLASQKRNTKTYAELIRIGVIQKIAKRQ
jgi:2-phospho-L-lactate guanylyltransferase